MASKYAMETVFSLIDQVSRPLDKIGIKGKSVSKKLQKDFVAAQKRLDNFGKAIVKWGKRAALAAAAVATAWAGMGVRNALQLTDTMARIGHAANLTGPPLEKMQQDLMDVSNRAGFAVNEIARLANESISSGVAAEGAANFAAVVAQTGTITQSSSDKIIHSLTTVMSAYGKTADEAARVSGMMINASRLGRTSFEDMSKGMRYVIPAAAAVGVSTEDVFASITALTSHGLETRDAMRSMGKAFSAIKRPSREAAELADRLGLDFSQAALESKGFAGVMEDIQRATGGNARALEILFGNEQTARSIGILATTGADSFSEALDAMSSSLNTVDDEFARVTDTPTERWRRAVNRIQNAGVNLGKAILPVVERVIARISDIADRISGADFSQYTGVIDTIFRKIERLVGAFVNIIRIAWQFRGVIIAIVGAMLLYRAALMTAALYVKLFAIRSAIAKAYTFANTLALKGKAAALGTLEKKTLAYNVTSKAFVVAEKAKATAIGITTGKITARTVVMKVAAVASKAAAVAAGVWTVAQKALNIALTANPIGVIIMAVAGLITLIVLLVRHIGRFVNAIRNGSEKAMFALQVLLGPIGLVISMVQELRSNWDNIREVLGGAGIIDGIKRIGTSIREFIQPAIDWLVGAWNRVKETVSGFFRNIGNAIKNFFTPVINWITGIWNAVSNAVVGVFKRIWDAVSTFLEPIFTWISNTWQKIVSFFKDSALIRAIKVIGGTLLSGLLAPIQGLLEILSHIPGLGHLAGRGANKIQELRDNLRGTNRAEVETEATKAIDELGSAPVDVMRTTQDANIPDLSFLDGGLGQNDRSRIRGVVDASGGSPFIPNRVIGGAGTTTTSAQPRQPTVSVQEAIKNATANVTSVLQEILAATNKAAANMEAPTTFNFPFPAMLQQHIDAGRTERERADADNPRNIAPVTSGERTAYSLRETRETLGIEVMAAQGTEARIVKAPRSPNIKVTHSGSNV
ncbi:MAG: phage tail tape measure protein [Treponema sp.]|nr:phage tail tape measure protein [Treponema sp.]